MAKAAGIQMSECRLLEDHECAHFMSKRFDRVNGKKLHMQTLCAMRHGAWHLAPAYDMTWAYKPGSKWTGQHQMSINGKRDGFSAEDFFAVAKHFDIAKPQEIISEVCESAMAFGDFAKEAGVAGSIAKQMLPEFRTYLKQ